MMWWSVMPSTSMPAASSRALAAAQRGDRVDAQRDVVDPRRRVRRRLGGDVVAEVEEGEVRAVGHAEEDVHVRAVLAGARHDVGADHVDQRQAEDVFVERARLLAVAAAIGVVMQAANRDEGCIHDTIRAAAMPRRQRIYSSRPLPFLAMKTSRPHPRHAPAPFARADARPRRSGQRDGAPADRSRRCAACRS